MFFGYANHVLDDKGRLAVPAKYRPSLAEGLALTIGLDKCLYILTLAGFDKMVEELEFHSKFNADARALRRSFFPNVELTTLDKQGRIIIPENHRIYASITSNVVIAGMNSCI